MAMKAAPSSRKITATAMKLRTRKRAEYTASREGPAGGPRLYGLGRGLPPGRHRHQQHVPGIDRFPPVDERQLVGVPQYNGLGRAGILTVDAENAAQHVDLIGAGIALARGEALLVGVLGGLHEDRIGRA